MSPDPGAIGRPLAPCRPFGRHHSAGRCPTLIPRFSRRCEYDAAHHGRRQPSGGLCELRRVIAVFEHATLHRGAECCGIVVKRRRRGLPATRVASFGRWVQPASCGKGRAPITRASPQNRAAPRSGGLLASCPRHDAENSTSQLLVAQAWLVHAAPDRQHPLDGIGSRAGCDVPRNRRRDVREGAHRSGPFAEPRAIAWRISCIRRLQWSASRRAVAFTLARSAPHG